MKKVRINPTIYGSTKGEQLDSIMMLGAVRFTFYCNKHGRQEARYGTRDLNFPGIPFDLLPMGIRETPEHVLTWIDLDKMAWRACRKADIAEIDPVIDVEDNTDIPQQ